MNPITNHNLGQMNHREYEARYGNNVAAETTPYKPPVSKQPKTVLMSVIAIFVFAFAIVPLLI